MIVTLSDPGGVDLLPSCIMSPWRQVCCLSRIGHLGPDPVWGRGFVFQN